MMSKDAIKILYQKMMSKYDIILWYQNMISYYDIILWYHTMTSYYDIILGQTPQTVGLRPPDPPGGYPGAAGLRDNCGLIHAILSEYDVKIWCWNMIS